VISSGELVDLYPPANAVVMFVDEKSQIQALSRTQPILPLRPRLFERRRSLERTPQLASAGHGLMYPNGAEAFGILVDAIDESGIDSDSPAAEDAALCRRPCMVT